VRDRERAKIILLRLDGLGIEAVAERLNANRRNQDRCQRLNYPLGAL
jgi:hypothetical protein